MQTASLIKEVFTSPKDINEIFSQYFEEKNHKLRPLEKIYEIGKLTNKFENPILIGELELEDGYQLDFFTVKTKENLSAKSSKKTQYEIAKELLKIRNKDAGIFIFYDEDGNFRFSFIFANYEGIKRQFSHYKRYTYFVSKNQPNRTFIERLDKANFSTLESIKEAFSVEPLTREFYNKIQNWYAWALKEIESKNASFPGGKDEENLIRLITRLIFVWFLKEKKLVPEEIFDESKLGSIVKDFKNSNNYYNVILQNLFFATLNTLPKDRQFANEGDFTQNREHFGVKILYRYSDKLKISKEEFIKLLETVPFINGGLFECLDRDKNYIDGFSRNEQKRAKLPDYLFFSEEKDIDLSSFYGSKKITKVKGLINILKEYNFTVDESSPIDIEVSLDPELLGHIFENLLASYSPDTKETVRKSTGSYYTPKEIVDFMVDQSLLYVIRDKTGIDEEKIRDLLSYSEGHYLTDEEKKKVIDVIDIIKIIDPAVGSGAFPMGILHKLVHILHKLDPDNKIWKEKQLQRLEKVKEEASLIGDFKVREELLKEIESKKENLEKAFENEIDYARKLYLIENSIYGIDIQPIAIQIAKLRFFLSLLIDQKVDVSKENYGILPLPNLETKFVSGNTLIKLFEKQISLKSNRIIELEKEYKELMKEYFSANNRNTKKRIKEKAQKIKEEMAKELKAAGFPNEAIEKILKFDIFDQLSSAYWFDPEWMFGINDGFDIVIGNPPYIRQEKIKDLKPALKKFYKIYNSTSDIYTYFYERACDILSDGGVYSYITSNKFMRAKYGKELREFLKKNTKINNIVDFGGHRVFESATVDTVIVIGQKEKPNSNDIQVCLIKDDFKKGMDINQYCREKGFKISQDKLLSEVWTFEDLDLKEKIEKVGIPLKYWDVKIYFGIKTGFNEAFIIDSKKREEILANCKTQEERKRTEEIIKPVLRGRDIEKWRYNWAGLWVIATFSGWTKKSFTENYENAFAENYPALYHYLLSKSNLINKEGKNLFNRPSQGDFWWEIQTGINVINEFEKEKIVWQRVTQQFSFCIVPKGMYILDSMAFMVGNDLHFLIGVLNSRLIDYYIKTYVHQYADKGFLLSNQYVERIPIPKVPEDKQKPIIDLVDKIMEITSRGDYKDNPQLQEKVKDYSFRIDQLVYQLYNLTDEEIERIERKIKKEITNNIAQEL
jgi:hypothetical protein